MKTPKSNSMPEPPAGPDRNRLTVPTEGEVQELVHLLDQYLADLQAGRKPDRAKLLADHPSLALQLEQALDGLEFIHQVPAGSAAAPARLGDFRIVRELGRGGMGVVYEAEQISLNRRVALKVLRFGAVADEVAMQRFQREAETVARLHHTNIVPIFAVGCEQGARYYAMQFIEGRDLAQLLAEARKARRPIAPATVVQWGLQAAEALAHAHARGVIHRDIKPSNLLLDADDRIWLTDFGLARRVDDAVLSVAGALLGTPRYMSPEQARASTDPIDHRTDIYSLGATLYELATGRPIFEAGTAQEVLSQILNREPRAPRQISPELPRDFETVILKCLAKEPGRRYATAQALADDLRALLEGRAVSARPPGVTERVTRWARKHRRSTTVAAISAGASLVFAVGGSLFWQAHKQARLGSLSLTTDSPNLLAEVVDADGRSLSPLFPVPTPEAVTLPAGSHFLRLSASGLLSETWPVEVRRGRSDSHFVQLNPGWLWPPGEVNAAEYQETEVVTLGSHADLLMLTHGTGGELGRGITRRLRLLDGSTGRPAWSAHLAFDEASLPAGADLGEWTALLRQEGFESILQDGGVAERARDLDGDGVGDPVLLSRTTPSLLAVSGDTGQVLWWARVRPMLNASTAGKELLTDAFKLARGGSGFVVGTPAVDDVDADGTPDFVACFRSSGDAYLTPDRTEVKTGAQSLLAAISGRTGTVLWQSPVDEDWSGYIYSSTDLEKYRPLCRPRLGQVDGRKVVVLIETSRLLGLDARTGEAAWPPLNLGFEPDHAPDIADLDGDGQSEALFLRVHEEPQEGRSARTKSGFSEEASLNLVALSLPDGALRWEKPFCVVPKWQAHELGNRRHHFHEIVDVDGDDVPEVILSGGWRTLHGGTRLSFDLVDGRTGTNRWHRLVWAEEHFGGVWNVDQFLVGPDLDGDGQRELFAAWDDYDKTSRTYGLSVAALSGADGAMLWRTHQPAVNEASSIAWWHAGADGWPLLLVSAERASAGQPVTLLLAAGSGRLEHTLSDVGRTRVADFDGDGILDLFYTVSPQGSPRNLVVKGSVPDAWRQLGDWRPAADLDGDGFADLVGIADRVLTARSGQDGRILWQAKRAPQDSPMEWPQPAGDFDGDGVSDVLATVNVWRQLQPQGRTTRRLPAAFSGKDGYQLWTAEELDILGGSIGQSGGGWSFRYPLMDWADLDHDGRAELFVAYQQPGASIRVSAVSGREGRVLWTSPAARGGFAPQPSPSGKPLADFNGDHVLDLALWVPAEPAGSEYGPLVLNVVDGRNGRPLWLAPALSVHHPDRLLWPEPVLADLGDDRTPDVLACRNGGFNPGTGRYPCELVALDGRDGSVRWTWSWAAGLPELWPPVALKATAAGRPSVCLVIRIDGASTLVALDAGGAELLRRTLNLPGTQFNSGRFVWRTADVNGDGREELLYLDEGQLCAAGGDALEVKWQWTLPTDEAVRLVEVQAMQPGSAPTLTVWCGKQVWAIDGPSGTPLWRCDVANRPHGGSDVAEVRRLAVAAAAAPRVQSFTPSQHPTSAASVVRQAWPVSTTGSYLSPVPASRSYVPLREVELPKRRLPWARDDETALVFSGGVTLLVAGIPAMLVWWAIRRRSWLTGLLPVGYACLSLLLSPAHAAFPAVIALGHAGWLGLWGWRTRRGWVVAMAAACAGLAAGILVGALAEEPPIAGPARLQLLLMTLAGVPGLVFWVMCGWAIKKRCWTRVGWLLGSSLLAALLVAVPFLWNDQQFREPEETYSLRGAYFIWFLGVAVVGSLGLFILATKRAARWTKRHRCGRQPATTSART